VPALFSFNSPLGACTTCQGFGRIIGIDRERVIPYPGRSLEQRPIAPWNTPAYEELYDGLFKACKKRRIPLDVPWPDLDEEDRRFVWSGSGFTNLERYFAWLERRSYRVHVRVLLARYRAYTPCPSCGGARLQPAALGVRLQGETLPELERRSVEELRTWLADQRFSRRQRARGGHLLDQLGERLAVLAQVGLDYLTLDRQARTLSGGETQRIHLAAALGSGLTDTLYVLDEPTVGLHPRDSGALLELLRELARRGNTVLVVEHDPVLIRGADWIIDLGPAAGEHGGEVVCEGTFEAISASDSLTARYLRRRPSREARRHAERRKRERGRADSTGEEIRIRGARAHNLRDLDVAFPVDALVAVTGVSGSGKSTLVETVLYGNAQRRRGTVDVEVGACDGIDGLDGLADVVLVDQRPLGRSSRSNPVTYVKAYDEIRKLYASLAEARRQGITAAHFSFNRDRGRCPECQGTGEVEVDMHFMAAVTVTCDSCQGNRFVPKVLAVRYRGRTIAETLQLTVSEALEVFAGRPALCRRLAPLAAVGLGYLRLGQTTATLSGGEAQRLKLATFLGGRRERAGSRTGRRLFLFDEPTTGLHLADVDLLHQTLRRLVRGGDGVVVVEHNLELVSRADWIVDLGPGGGDRGGRLLYSGPLAGFVDSGDGPTAEELRAHFAGERSRALR
jgi:excinuclease ABC subunit A